MKRNEIDLNEFLNVRRVGNSILVTQVYVMWWLTKARRALSGFTSDVTYINTIDFRFIRSRRSRFEALSLSILNLISDLPHTKSLHYGDVKRPSWRLDFTVNQFFVQQFAQTDRRYRNIKSTRYCSFVTKQPLTQSGSLYLHVTKRDKLYAQFHQVQAIVFFWKTTMASSKFSIIGPLWGKFSGLAWCMASPN